MSPISSSSVSTAPTPSVNSTSSAVADLQKQLQQQDVREKAKPVVEQVYISQQAQQQLDTYTASAANAAERDSADPAASSNTGVSTDQVLDTVKTIQNRQTAAALAQYASQQAEASPPKPEVELRTDAKPTASIQAIA